jgi:hypothetical protein
MTNRRTFLRALGLTPIALAVPTVEVEAETVSVSTRPEGGPYRTSSNPREGWCFVSTHPPLPNAVVWVDDSHNPSSDDRGWRGYTDEAGTIELHTTLIEGEVVLVRCRQLGVLPMEIQGTMSEYGLHVTFTPKTDHFIYEG